jgi:hypothetical protein
VTTVRGRLLWSEETERGPGEGILTNVAILDVKMALPAVGPPVRFDGPRFTIAIKLLGQVGGVVVVLSPLLAQ